MITLEPTNRVREFRQRKGLTLHRLSVLIDTSPQNLHHLETQGKRRPWSFDLEKLAWVLGTTVDELFPVAASRPGTADAPPDTQKAS